MGRRTGSAMVEYAAIVAIVATVVVVLTTVRPQRAGRVPIDPVKALRVHVRPPPSPIVRRPRPVVVPGAPPRTRRGSPRRPGRAVVWSPQWFGSW